MSILTNVQDRKLIGTVVRVGRDKHFGPMFRLAQYDKTRQTFTAINTFNGTSDTFPLADLDQGLAEGIIHIIGKLSVKENQ